MSIFWIFIQMPHEWTWLVIFQIFFCFNKNRTLVVNFRYQSVEDDIEEEDEDEPKNDLSVKQQIDLIMEEIGTAQNLHCCKTKREKITGLLTKHFINMIHIVISQPLRTKN